MAWNGRRILVWKMEDAQNVMEDLKNGMEGRLPYQLHIQYISLLGGIKVILTYIFFGSAKAYETNNRENTTLIQGLCWEL